MAAARAGSRVLLSPVLYVTAAVVLRRRIDWRYQLIALQVMQQHAIDAGVTWRASVPSSRLGTAVGPATDRTAAGGRAGVDPPGGAAAPTLPMQSAHWNFDAGRHRPDLCRRCGVSELPYRPGPGLFYINRPTVDGKRVVLPTHERGRRD